MTEVQNTPTPVAPPLTDHFHTVPHWTHTRLVSQLGVVVECIEASVVLWWAFGVLGSTPAHSWLLNRHTVFWKSDGHTEINRARWHAPFAQCVEAFVATERPRGCLMDISRGFDCTVISLSDLNSARDYNHFPLTDHAADSCEQVRLSFHFCLWIYEEMCNKSGLKRWLWRFTLLSVWVFVLPSFCNNTDTSNTTVALTPRWILELLRERLALNESMLRVQLNYSCNSVAKHFQSFLPRGAVFLRRWRYIWAQYGTLVTSAHIQKLQLL